MYTCEMRQTFKSIPRSFTFAEPPKSPFVGQWVLDHGLRTRGVVVGVRVLLFNGSRRARARNRWETTRGDGSGRRRRLQRSKGGSGSGIQGESRHRGAAVAGEPKRQRECRSGNGGHLGHESHGALGLGMLSRGEMDRRHCGIRQFISQSLRAYYRPIDGGSTLQRFVARGNKLGGLDIPISRRFIRGGDRIFHFR